VEESGAIKFDATIIETMPGTPQNHVFLLFFSYLKNILNKPCGRRAFYKLTFSPGLHYSS